MTTANVHNQSQQISLLRITLSYKVKSGKANGPPTSNKFAQPLHHRILDAQKSNADAKYQGAMPTKGQPSSWSETVRDSSCAASESQHERRHTALLSG